MTTVCLDDSAVIAVEEAEVAPEVNAKRLKNAKVERIAHSKRANNDWRTIVLAELDDDVEFE